MFLLQDNEVILDPDLIAGHNEFLQIWNRDTTPDKVEAIAFFRYIFNMINPKSFFYGLGVEDRIVRIRSAYFPDSLKTWRIAKDKLMLSAMDSYRKFLNFAPEREMLEIAEDVLHDLANKIKKKTTENREELLVTMQNSYKKVVELRAIVYEEENKRKVTVGERVLSPREDPDYKPLFLPKTNIPSWKLTAAD